MPGIPSSGHGIPRSMKIQSFVETGERRQEKGKEVTLGLHPIGGSDPPEAQSPHQVHLWRSTAGAVNR
ncbi:hypothetical protein SKAU_G00392750 [Synaphobranchus kaupii]|uniref:Uncharacterized protein n=1 Tax=Synaphobranchus kaupii TaxID=118154 RepID=A0A9Q1EBT3_SYNKA|nr:hypothetical protein SKAU_G00392750 [Synaphobranchus kaupii]